MVLLAGRPGKQRCFLGLCKCISQNNTAWANTLPPGKAIAFKRLAPEVPAAAHFSALLWTISSLSVVCPFPLPLLLPLAPTGLPPCLQSSSLVSILCEHLWLPSLASIQGTCILPAALCPAFRTHPNGWYLWRCSGIVLGTACTSLPPLPCAGHFTHPGSRWEKPKEEAKGAKCCLGGWNWLEEGRKN